MNHIPLQPVKLTPIPWGQRDPELARETCARIETMTPRFHYKPAPKIPAALGWACVAIAATAVLAAFK